MSQAVSERASTQAEIRHQLEQITGPWEKSCQAHGDPNGNRHNDGEAMHQYFGIPPLHKWLHRATHPRNDTKKPEPIARFPGAFVDMMVYTSERDLELLSAIAGEVDYDAYDASVSHSALERYPRYRAKMMEWIAADRNRVRDITGEGGTDMLMHGPPGNGKTTLANSTFINRMQVNNETTISAESVDESGTNDRTEWLRLAPFATIAVPSGLDPVVRIVPNDPTVPEFEVELGDIARDVIYYDSVQDLMTQLMPGQFYVIYPDPLHRGCNDVSNYRYYNYEQVTPVGEEGPNEPTPADHWWFAFIAHRISGDVFAYPTFINFDEAGNLFDADAKKDVHQTYQKIKWYRDKYADARKKGVSFGYETHSLAELHKFPRAKIRWRVTMAGASPPMNRRLPGDRQCPLLTDRTSSMDPGEAMIWKAPYFAKITWPNLNRLPQGVPMLDAEVSIDFKNWQEVVSTHV